MAAVVIAAIDYVIQKVFKWMHRLLARYRDFFISIGHIFNSVFVPDMEVNLFGAIVAAIIIGIIDAIIPANVI